MLKNLTQKQKHAVLAAMALMFAYGLTNNTVGFFITPVTEALGCSRASFNLYYTVMSIVSLCVSPVFGQLLQKVPVRRILFVGAVWGAVCFVLFSLCSSMPMFYIVAVVIGLIQSGTTNVSAVVIVNRAFTGSSGTATGLAMAGTGICSTVMSLILPGFIGATSWQTGYIMQAAVWFAALAVAGILVGNESPVQPAAAAEKKESGDAAPAEGWTFAQATRSADLYILIVLIVIFTVTSIFVQHMPAFFIEQGASSTVSGYIMSVFSIFLIICKIGLGSLCDRIGTVKTTVIAYCAYAVGLWVMLMGNMVFLCVGSAFAAFGLASSTVLTPMITKTVFGTKEYAPIWSVVSMAVALGAALGSPAWGFVYDTMGSYHTAVMTVPVVVIITGILLAVVMKKKRF